MELIRRTWVKVGCALALALVLLVVLAPRLLGGYAAGVIEERFAADYRGTLEVSPLELRWRGRQHVREARLVDPDGETVLVASVELPALLALVNGGGSDLGRIDVTATADLVADEEGLTNLQRALRPQLEPEEPAAEEPGDEPRPEGGDELPTFELRIHCPRLSWSDARTRRTGAPLVLRELEAHVSSKGGLLDAQVDSDVAESGDGSLRARVRAADNGASGDIEVFADELPTALVDGLMEQNGLLVDVLGPAIRIDLKGSWPEGGEPLRLDARSDQASLTFVGTMRDGALVATEGQKLEATLPLSPIFSERVVGGLVPVLFQMQKPEGAAPVGLAVQDFRLPLDGDLGKLDALVTLHLGEVAYQLAPGLQGLLAAVDAGTERRLTDIRPLQVKIEHGVARYDRMPLSIGGHELVFRGSYDLALSELDLATSVPLRLLGGSVARELERARDYLDPNLAVPIELGGSWKSPKINVGDSFLEDTVREAARGALSRGLQDLLKRDD